MAKLISKKFNVHNAQQFKEGFDESSPTQMYLFYSRIDPWSNESDPPPLSDTESSDRNAWRGMIALKKISNNNVTMAVSKYIWQPGTVYTEFNDNNANLPERPFFVFSSNNEVGKNWPSPYTKKSIDYVLASTKENLNEWITVKANVKEDFKKFHNLDVNELDGLAIMSDTDNSKMKSIAYFQNIYFSTE